MNSINNARNLGLWAERQAKTHLSEQGLSFITQNYTSRYGEIDLIFMIQNELIFVEVKARSSVSYGAVAEMISRAKQKKIVKTAMCFLQEFPQYEHYSCRFDVVCIEITQQFAKLIQQDFSSLSYDLDWIENAFVLDEF